MIAGGGRRQRAEGGGEGRTTGLMEASDQLLQPDTNVFNLTSHPVLSEDQGLAVRPEFTGARTQAWGRAPRTRQLAQGGILRLLTN